jgi:glycosyl transferase family 25
MSHINTFFDKIFYINLKKDVDRNNYMINQFKEFGITNYERFEAIEYNEIPDKTLWRNFTKQDEKYVKGSIGCRDSHLGILKLAKERDYKFVMILEDDIKILTNLSDLLEANSFQIYMSDMLYFGGLVEPQFRGQVVGAYAYAIRNTLFDDILNLAIPSGMEIDTFYAKIIQHMTHIKNKSGRYNALMLQPENSIIVDIKFKSNIRDDNSTIWTTTQR